MGRPRTIDPLNSLTKLTRNHRRFSHGLGNSASHPPFLQYKEAADRATTRHAHLLSKERGMFSANMSVGCKFGGTSAFSTPPGK